MILYNITISIDPSIEQEWLLWMRQFHIPKVMKTGGFTESRLCRVHAEEEGGLTYAVGYVAPSKEQYENYRKYYAAQMQKEHLEKFTGKFAAFRTLLTVVEEFKLDNQ